VAASRRARESDEGPARRGARSGSCADAGGRGAFSTPFALIDAWGYGNRTGRRRGIPHGRTLPGAADELQPGGRARERPLALRREACAGDRRGASAATTVAALASSPTRRPARARWVTRGAARRVCAGVANDPCRAVALYQRARALAAGGNAAITHVGARWSRHRVQLRTHRYRVNLRVGELARTKRSISSCQTGSVRQLALSRAAVHECYTSRDPEASPR